MTHVYLIRHGQASAGTDNYDRLSPTGIEQSRLLGTFWNQTGIRFDAAFAGTLERQQHTAELALASLHEPPSVQTLDGLNEYDHKIIDRLYGGGVQSDIGNDLRFDQYVAIMSRWRDAIESKDKGDNAITGEAPSWQSFSEQGWNTVREVVEQHRQETTSDDHANLVFFTSGGVIATILAQAMSTSFDVAMHSLWQTRNASITTLLFNKHGIALVDYNTVPHLQLAGQTELITQI